MACDRNRKLQFELRGLLKVSCPVYRRAPGRASEPKSARVRGLGT